MSDRAHTGPTENCRQNAPDRIFVRDFVKDVEIGAFQSERDVVQRIMFNVVLDVASANTDQIDDVDQILSYDAITDAIEHQLAVERLNLLETLAERIASEILQHGRAQHVMVRIEKLDRIPGTLGIEIQRRKNPLDTRLMVNVANSKSVVAVLPNDQLSQNALRGWIDQLSELERPVVICLDVNPVRPSATGADVADRRIGLLSIEQNAWAVAAADTRCTVVDSRTEMDWAIKNGLLAIWAPTKLIMDAVDDGSNLSATGFLGLAQWLAGQLGVQDVLVLGASAATLGTGLVPVRDRQALAAQVARDE